jgi:hypothetical protein
MYVAMDCEERRLFESFVNCSQRYLEFGVGGSTWLACSRPKEWVISIDSDSKWLDTVQRSVSECPTQPIMMRADIGPVKEWGYPVDESNRSLWPTYHDQVWKRKESSAADFFLVDGRFRVACAIQCILHCQPTAFIAVHDYSDRPHYHVIARFLREVASANRLSIFMCKPDLDQSAASDLLAEYSCNPA